jgi:hypothetical protein
LVGAGNGRMGKKLGGGNFEVMQAQHSILNAITP